MKTLPEPANPTPHPLRVRRWRTILAGGVLAGVGFVAAQAGSIGFLQVEFAKLAKAVDEKPIVVRTSNQGQHRSYSKGSTGGQQEASFGAARSSSLSQATPGHGLRFEASDTQATGDAMTDAGLFELSPVATPMSLAASQEPLRLGGRFHGLIDGAGSPSERPTYGSSGRRVAQKDLADCCSNPETQPGDPLLTAPALDDAISGPVPEPVAWSLMIMGFGLSGLVLRGQRRRLI